MKNLNHVLRIDLKTVHTYVAESKHLVKPHGSQIIGLSQILCIPGIPVPKRGGTG